MNKAIGYILGVAGIALFAFSYPSIRTMLGITSLPINIADIYLTITGVILLLVGAYLAFKSSTGEQPKEIPVYEGHGKSRKVVALQRVKD